MCCAGASPPGGVCPDDAQNHVGSVPGVSIFRGVQNNHRGAWQPPRKAVRHLRGKAYRICLPGAGVVIIISALNKSIFPGKGYTEACCKLSKSDMKGLVLQVHRATGHDGKELAVKVLSAAKLAFGA